MSQNQEQKEETNNDHLSIDIDDVDALDDDQVTAIIAENNLITQQVQQREIDQAAHLRQSHIRSVLAENQRLKHIRDELLNPSTPPVRQSANVHFAPASSFIEHSNRVDRSLSFTPITDGRLDSCAAALARPARTTTASSATATARDDSDDITSILNMEVPKPEPFNGKGRPATADRPSETVQVRLEHFIRSVERFIEYKCLCKNITPTAAQFCKLASLFLVDDAADMLDKMVLIANEAARVTGVLEPLTWPDVRRQLRKEYAKPVPGYQLIAEMVAMRQRPTESVEEFTKRFDDSLTELVRQKLASRDLAASLFLGALLPHIREKILEIMGMQEDYFEEAKITSTESRAAVSHLQRIATARERTLAATRQSIQPVSKPLQAVQQPSHQTTKPASPSPEGERNFRVPVALFEERKLAGLCGRCGGAGHKTYGCRKPPQPTALNIPRGSGRANMMSITDESAQSSDRVNNAPSTTQQDQKNP